VLPRSLVLSGGGARATQVELSGVAQLDARYGHACVVTTGGGVKCWGGDGWGQLGDGLTGSRYTANDVPGLTSGAVSVAVGGGHSCAIVTGGGVKCWGLNASGQLGDGTTTQRLTPVDVTGLPGPVVALSAGNLHTCAVLGSGAAMCWGLNGNGRLGDGTTTQRLVPTLVSGLATGVVKVSAGRLHTCAILGSGAAKCWGSNPSGELGDGTRLQRTAPVDVVGLTTGVAAIATGGSDYDFNYGGGGYTCAIASGVTKCWGQNHNAQSGEVLCGGVPCSDFQDRLTPSDVQGIPTGATAIAASGWSTPQLLHGSISFAQNCVVTAAGGARCWGSLYCGVLGDGVSGCTIDQSGWGEQSRRRRRALERASIPFSAAILFTCALLADGHVKCFGSGYGNQPVAVKDGTEPQAIIFGQAPSIHVNGWGAVTTFGGQSGNPVILTSLTPSSCSVSGNAVMGLASATCTVAANQAGNAYFDPAPQATLSFLIDPHLAQTITFGAAPSLVVNGVATVSATASSGLPVTLVSYFPRACTVSGNVVTGVGVGSCTLTANQAGDSTYAPASASLAFPVGADAGTLALFATKSGVGSGTITSSSRGNRVRQ